MNGLFQGPCANFHVWKWWCVGVHSLFRGGGCIVKWREVPHNVCHSQFYRQHYDETCVSTQFEITPPLSSLWNIHWCNYSKQPSACLHLCVLRRRYGVWKVTHNCLYINLHHIREIDTWLHATSLLIKQQQQQKKKLPAERKKKSQENFKVLRINPAEAPKVKSALIKFHVKCLSRFWCECKDLQRRQRKPRKRSHPRR